MAPGLLEFCQAQSIRLWAAKRQSILSSVLYTFPTCLLPNESGLVLAMSIQVPSKDSKSRSGSLSNSPLPPKEDAAAVTTRDQQGLFLQFSVFPPSRLEMPVVTKRLYFLSNLSPSFPRYVASGPAQQPQGTHSQDSALWSPTKTHRSSVVAGNQGVAYQTSWRRE